MGALGEYLTKITGGQAADAPFIKTLDEMTAYLSKIRGSSTDLVREEVLRSFVRCGHAPDAESVSQSLGLSSDTVKAAFKILARADLVVIGTDNGPISAYPFSGTPTAHKVYLETGSTVYALCAIDALGMASMLDQPVNISSSCRQCGSDLEISVDPAGEVTKAPTGVLVWLTLADGGACIARTRCPQINFFCSAKCAEAWQSTNPAEIGVVLDLGQAAATGKRLFGDFLSTKEEHR